MAMTGPPPKPTRLKELAGNPGKRPLNKKEPKFTAIHNPEPPSTMDQNGKKLWKKLVEQLAMNGLLQAPHLEHLEIYCRSWSEYCKCQTFIKKYGSTYEAENKNGTTYVQQYPQVNMAINYAKLMDRISSKFGLTPADASRLHASVGGADDEDGIEGIFTKRRSG